MELYLKGPWFETRSGFLLYSIKFLCYSFPSVGLSWASVGYEKGVSYQILTNLFTVKMLTVYFIFISKWLHVLSAALLLAYQVALTHFSMWQYTLSVQIRWLFSAVWFQVHYWEIPHIILHKAFQELGNIFIIAVIFKPIFYCSWNRNMNHNSDSVNTFFF